MRRSFVTIYLSFHIVKIMQLRKEYIRTTDSLYITNPAFSDRCQICNYARSFRKGWISEQNMRDLVQFWMISPAGETHFNYSN